MISTRCVMILRITHIMSALEGEKKRKKRLPSLDFLFSIDNCCLLLKNITSLRGMGRPFFSELLICDIRRLVISPIQAFKTRTRDARYTLSTHPHFPRIPLLSSKFHSDSYVPRNVKFWNRILRACFADYYELYRISCVLLP